LSRRRFTKECKLAAVRRLEAGESGSGLARKLEVKCEKLCDWQAQVERYGVEGAFPGPGRRPSGSTRVEPGGEAQARVAELERKVGRQAVEIDFLSAALRRVVGWAVGPNMKTELPLAARTEALSSRGPAPCWMHHSDQG